MTTHYLDDTAPQLFRHVTGRAGFEALPGELHEAGRVQRQETDSGNVTEFPAIPRRHRVRPSGGGALGCRIQRPTTSTTPASRPALATHSHDFVWCGRERRAGCRGWDVERRARQCINNMSRFHVGR
jgi:hypothetical protein